MRKKIAILTFLIVGVLTFFGMSKSAFADLGFSDLPNFTIVKSHYPYAVDCNIVSYSDSISRLILDYDAFLYLASSGIYSVSDWNNFASDYYPYHPYSFINNHRCDGSDFAPGDDLSSIPSGEYFYVYSTSTDSVNYSVLYVQAFYFDTDLNELMYSTSTNSVDYFTTRFISLSPEFATTTATTTDIGANLYFNSSDLSGDYSRLHIHLWQDSAFACQNSGAVYDAVVTCAGENSPASSFDIDFDENILDRIISGGYYDFSTSTTFVRGGIWNAEYILQNVSTPWYLFGLVKTYSDIISSSSQFIVGQKSPMDIVREDIDIASNERNEGFQSRVGDILASTTASLSLSCTPLTSTFDMGDCLTLIFYPGKGAIEDDLLILRSTAPWGYGFRLYDIFKNTPIASTSLPVISYDFATSSQLSDWGNLTFDPFGTILESGELINDFHSDRGEEKNVWEIMMPLVDLFIYFVLFIFIIRDLFKIL